MVNKNDDFLILLVVLADMSVAKEFICLQTSCLLHVFVSP